MEQEFKEKIEELQRLGLTDVHGFNINDIVAELQINSERTRRQRQKMAAIQEQLANHPFKVADLPVA